MIFVLAAVVAAWGGIGSARAAWLTSRARLAWCEDPVAWFRQISGAQIREADVRFVTAMGAVLNSEMVSAPWIVVALNSEAPVVESMIPWPLHGPKVVYGRSDIPALVVEDRYVRDPSGTFSVTVRKDWDDFIGMLADLGWLEPPVGDRPCE